VGLPGFLPAPSGDFAGRPPLTCNSHTVNIAAFERQEITG